MVGYILSDGLPRRSLASFSWCQGLWFPNWEMKGVEPRNDVHTAPHRHGEWLCP